MRPVRGEQTDRQVEAWMSSVTQITALYKCGEQEVSTFLFSTATTRRTLRWIRLQQWRTTSGSTAVSQEQKSEAVGTVSSKLDSRRLEKRSGWYLLRQQMVGWEFGINGMNPWTQTATVQAGGGDLMVLGHGFLAHFGLLSQSFFFNCNSLSEYYCRPCTSLYGHSSPIL